MKISLIVAMAQNRVIGSKNTIPWHIPGELPRFKRITTGHPIIMGRKTYESIGRPLPNRTNIVITRDEGWSADGVVVVNSLEKALDEAKKYYVVSSKYQEDLQNTENEVFIIGGGQIFKEAMEIADKLYLTILHKDVQGDTYFPKYEQLFTKEISREVHSAEDYTYTFLELEK